MSSGLIMLSRSATPLSKSEQVEKVDNSLVLVVHLFRLQKFLYKLKYIPNSNLYKMSNTKKLIFVAVLIIGLIILFFTTNSANSKKSNKFIGSIQTVGEDSMVVLGSFDYEKGAVSSQYEYEIKVPASAKITKNSFELPKGERMFEVDKLPKETADVDFSTLKTDAENVAIGLEVILSRDFFGRIQNQATQIIYIGPKY